MASFATIAFYSCGDDDDDVAPGKGTPSSEAGLLDKSSGLRVRSVGNYTFEYDSKGRIDYVSEGSYFGYKFTYNPNKITGEYYGEEELSYAVGYNGNGYMSSLSYNYSDENETGTATLTYDSDGHLTQVSTSYKEGKYEDGVRYYESEQGTSTMTWKNGRLTKAVAKLTWKERDGDSGTETDTWTFDYSDYALENYYNKYLQMPHPILRAFDLDDGEFMAYVGLLGNGPKYLPSSAERVRVEYENGEEDRDERHYSFSYGFNNDGSLSYCNDDGSRYSYSYDYSGADSHKAPSVMPDQDKSEDANLKEMLRGLFRHHSNRK